MEVASFLNGKAKSISIIGRSKYPFAHNLGEKIGQQFKKLYESKGIKFYTECYVKEFRGVNNELKELLLSNNEVVTADLCVVGIGSDPNVNYLKDTDIRLDDSYVVVNSNFETSVKNVYAGGDIVRYPITVLDNALVNVGHWQTAQSHGKFAALNMLGKPPTFKSVPFFWAMMLGKGIRFAGNADGFKDVIIDGDLTELKFVAYYINSAGRVTAVATIGNDPIAPLFAASLRNGKVLTESDIKTDPKKWIKSMTNG
jgi:NADPH-dependent 2,4-dienoyl-CoA reductase/sulfur reductase-like enzyme